MKFILLFLLCNYINRHQQSKGVIEHWYNYVYSLHYFVCCLPAPSLINITETTTSMLVTTSVCNLRVCVCLKEMLDGLSVSLLSFCHSYSALDSQCCSLCAVSGSATEHRCSQTHKQIILILRFLHCLKPMVC